MTIGFDIWKGLCVAHAAFGRFVNHISAFHVSPVLDLISTLNWFDSASLKLQHGWYFFNDEMMRQILVKIHQRSSSKTSWAKGDFIRFELQNKQSPLSVHKLQWPETHSWFFGYLVLIKRLFSFCREVAGQVNSLYFKHWP